MQLRLFALLILRCLSRFDTLQREQKLSAYRSIGKLFRQVERPFRRAVIPVYFGLFIRQMLHLFVSCPSLAKRMSNINFTSQTGLNSLREKIPKKKPKTATKKRFVRLSKLAISTCTVRNGSQQAKRVQQPAVTIIGHRLRRAAVQVSHKKRRYFAQRPISLFNDCFASSQRN